MGEFGVYEIIAGETLENRQCETKTHLEPVNIYLRELNSTAIIDFLFC